MSVKLCTGIRLTCNFMSHGFKIWLGVVVYVFNLSIWKAEADRSLKVQGQPGLYNEFLANQGYKVRPYLKKQKTQLFEGFLYRMSFVYLC